MSFATNEFLDTLKVLYPTANLKSTLPVDVVLDNKWYIATVVAFSASNSPEDVPLVFQNAMQDLANAHSKSQTSPSKIQTDQLRLARRFRDALFVAGITSGYARCINSCMALHEVTPEELRDTKMLRDASVPIEKLDSHGKEVFHAMYGETADPVQGILDSIYPDLGWFCNTIGYGFVYGHDSVLSQLETSYTMVASLIASDTPRQITWHMSNARRGGATLEEVRAIRLISMQVSEKAGVKWKAGVPEIQDDTS